jgi:hypothetical protein
MLGAFWIEPSCSILITRLVDYEDGGISNTIDASKTASKTTATTRWPSVDAFSPGNAWLWRKYQGWMRAEWVFIHSTMNALAEFVAVMMLPSLSSAFGEICCNDAA